MNMRATQLILILLCAAGLGVTSLAAGWFLLVFGLGFILSFFLHTWMVLAASPVWRYYKKRIFALTAIFLLFYVFREDFSDGAVSATSPLAVIGAELGLIESAFYEETSFLGALINFLWLPLIGTQVGMLVGIRQRKRQQRTEGDH